MGCDANADDEPWIWSIGKMRAGSLGFLVGLLVVLGLPRWPEHATLLGCLAASLALVPRWWSWWRWLLAGVAWALISIAPTHQQLPSDLEGVDLRVQGWVEGLPQDHRHRQRLILRVESLDTVTGQSLPFQGRVLLSWYGNEPLDIHAGERWALTVRLKRPHGLMNPGGGDVERWFLTSGISARGYIREAPSPRRLAVATGHMLDVWREHLAWQLRKRLPEDPRAGLLIALAVGDRRQVSEDQRVLLQRTGTSHLLAISGLHVGLVGGWWYLMAACCWRRSARLCRYLATPRAAALAAIPGALLYAMLAGLSLPTQRAVAMILLAMVGRFWLRPISFTRVLAGALVFTLLVNPLAPLSPGFWLSFGAVALIAHVLAGHPRLAPEQLWWRIQWGITLGLTPLGLMAFQGASLVSPLANLVAIPWASLTVVPLSLLTALVDLPWLGDGLAFLALGSIGWLLDFLAYLARWEGSFLHWPRPDRVGLLLAILGALWLLSPRGVPGRWLGVLLWLPLLTVPPGPAVGALWFSLVDVGDGLAAVVRTHQHVLVYDTGGRWRGGNAASGTLVPLLRQAGISHIDRLILSHDDSLHTGGARALMEAFSIGEILTPAPSAMPIADALPCRAGQEWRWDGVRFLMLSPTDTGLSGDDQSCVLQVDDRLLLPGDLELAGQRALLNRDAGSVKVLIAPHHGRRDSVLEPWLNALSPELVLFSTAHGNRHGYPRASTCQRYATTGARLLDTAQQGAISVRFDEGGEYRLISERQRRRRFWHGSPSSTCTR